MSNELKSASSVKTGKKFSEKRNNIGFTIEEISEKLFINKDYISAIEKGNYSIFPSESFAKAYFNKYKNFLKISLEFPSLFDQKIEKKHKKISNEIAFENNFDFIFNNLYVIVAIALIVIFGIYYLFKSEQLSDVVPQENINVDNVAEIVENVNQKNQSSTITQNIDKNLILEFSGESWIELYVENELVEAQIFSNGDIYERQIEIPFKIIVGNADFVKGSYNNTEIDFLTNANRLTGVNTINF